MKFLSASTSVALLASTATFVAASEDVELGLEERAAPRCRDFNVPITAQARNKIFFKPTDDLSTVEGVTSFLSSGAGFFGQLFGRVSQGGTFPMSMRYCEPKKNANAPASRKRHVQLLMHGIPYTKNYWEGQHMGAVSKRYSWVDHMTSMGYPTLSFDNLGNGNSTVTPNPILTVQQPLEVEIVHQIVRKLRAGTIGHGVPKARKVIYVGHSYASVLGNAVMYRHPKDFDAALLTGYTYTIANAVPGVLLAALAPARLYDPERYGHLPPAYITFASRNGKRNSYYGDDGAFNPKVANFDFDNQGITTIGEIATFFGGLQKAPRYKGHVFAITGEQDALFCGLGSRLLEKPDCGRGRSSVPGRTAEFFPNAAKYSFYLPPGTSHATNLHHSAQSIFKQASSFLQRQGY